MNLSSKCIRQLGEKAALTVEAAFLLVLCRLAIALLSHRYVIRLVSKPMHRGEPTSPRRAVLCRSVQTSLARACRLAPLNFVCYPRALAAHLMLRRRGVSTQLYFGASIDSGQPPHAWLQDGAAGIIGMPAVQRHVPIVMYGPGFVRDDRR